jgi:cation transport protein ChaC
MLSSFLQNTPKLQESDSQSTPVEHPMTPHGSADGNPPCWIFGYGSLIWRTGFPFAAARPAFVEGYKRRFWQGSIDHRGVPGAPGRVVTLAEAAGARSWGQAYRLEAGDHDAVLAQLDQREVGGYERHVLDLTLDDGKTVRGLTWVAWPDNPNYLGPASAGAIAAQAARAVGPSGSNAEYVLRLEAALCEPVMFDHHVSAIADRLRELL